MNYAKYLNRLSSLREPCPLREMVKLMEAAPKDTIAVSVGMPNPQMFPFKRLDVEIAGGGGSLSFTVSEPEHDIFAPSVTLLVVVGRATN